MSLVTLLLRRLWNKNNGSVTTLFIRSRYSYLLPIYGSILYVNPFYDRSSISTMFGVINFCLSGRMRVMHDVCESAWSYSCSVSKSKYPNIVESFFI